MKVITINCVKVDVLETDVITQIVVSFSLNIMLVLSENSREFNWIILEFGTKYRKNSRNFEKKIQ